jgi:hypothetical protein
MDYQIVLSPTIEVSPADFVADWNASNETRAVATAHLTTTPGTHYDPFLVGAIATLTSVGLGIATNAIYDLIKQIIVKKNEQQSKHIRITQVDQPDGTHLLVVDIEEK